MGQFEVPTLQFFCFVLFLLLSSHFFFRLLPRRSVDPGLLSRVFSNLPTEVRLLVFVTGRLQLLLASFASICAVHSPNCVFPKWVQHCILEHSCCY